MQINIFALGGLGELGKNMYILNIEGEYFIVDAGIKFPNSSLYGVEKIIPDFRFLIQNQKNIKGIFITSAFEEHVGALYYLLLKMKIPVFANNFTIEIIKKIFFQKRKKIDNFTFNIINENSFINFKNTQITFFHNGFGLPESLGIVFQTKLKNIVFVPYFSLLKNYEKYNINLKKIIEKTNQKTSVLLLGSVTNDKISNINNKNKLSNKLDDLFAKYQQKIIFSFFSFDIEKIQIIINQALKYQKKILFFGKKNNKIIDLAIIKKYLNIPQENLLLVKNLSQKQDFSNSLIIVLENRINPFQMLQEVCGLKKKNNHIFTITNKDLAIIVKPDISNLETVFNKMINSFLEKDINVEILNYNLITGSYPSSEEIKTFINLIKPKYIIPIMGEYRHQYNISKKAQEIGYLENKILLLNNGDQFSLTEKEIKIKTKAFAADEIFIDGHHSNYINNFVLKEREVLAKDGFVIVAILIIKKNEQVVDTQIKLESKGLAYFSEYKNISQQIIEIISKEEKFFHNKKIEKSKNYLQRIIYKFIWQKLKRKPLITVDINFTNF